MMREGVVVWDWWELRPQQEPGFRGGRDDGGGNSDSDSDGRYSGGGRAGGRRRASRARERGSRRRGTPEPKLRRGGAVHGAAWRRGATCGALASRCTRGAGRRVVSLPQARHLCSAPVFSVLLCSAAVELRERSSGCHVTCHTASRQAPPVTACCVSDFGCSLTSYPELLLMTDSCQFASMSVPGTHLFPLLPSPTDSGTAVHAAEACLVFSAWTAFKDTPVSPFASSFHPRTQEKINSLLSLTDNLQQAPVFACARALTNQSER